MFKTFIAALAIMLAPGLAFGQIDGNLIKKAENYLNALTGLEGDFSQTVNRGRPESGKFYMLRPGRLRLDYDKMPVQLISDGSNLFFYDKSLDQITTIPASATPASILTRDKIDLVRADILVVETNQYSKGFSLKLILKDNPGLGQMRVIFADEPARLSGWELIDATGSATVVDLKSLKTRTDFPRGFFNVQRRRTEGVRTGDAFYE
ncbi:MAG: outer membrane lipoprotein carrier protein LolA [Alphaproteobacteria bacterium]|nr:outer membrane lipoprotein carrier protein LolA [Alphaproteobacteria bacterium]